MRLRAATITCLQIPFVEAFAHATKQRTFSDSVVVRVVDESGCEGFGEGAPRPYVTGESVAFMRRHLCQGLLPALAGKELPEVAAPGALGLIDAAIPTVPAEVIDNASRAALELALLDCALRGAGRPMAALLPPVRTRIVYSGVITAGAPGTVAQHARQMKLVGLRHVKIKVGSDDDLARVQAARDILGPEVSLRIDANGAWDLETAARVLATLAPLGIASVEQPLPRGAPAELARLKERSSIPIVVDESLVTAADGEALIAGGAADVFNVRVSKCGGLARSLALARRAAEAGLAVQVGSQVGETAILSAAGRHLAAAVPALMFAEGSYGTLLLTEDISAEAVRFGHRGEAPLLTGPGLGIRVVEERLRKYAASIDDVTLG